MMIIKTSPAATRRFLTQRIRLSSGFLSANARLHQLSMPISLVWRSIYQGVYRSEFDGRLVDYCHRSTRDGAGSPDERSVCGSMCGMFKSAVRHYRALLDGETRPLTRLSSPVCRHPSVVCSHPSLVCRRPSTPAADRASASNQRHPGSGAPAATPRRWQRRRVVALPSVSSVCL